MFISADILFSIANGLAALGWLLLVLFPNRRVTRLAVRNGLLPIVLAVGYAVLLVVFGRDTDGGFDSLPAVQSLFAHPYILLAGWVHYLAFDLFVGIWELNDAQRRGLPHLLTIPSLLLTFLFGPAGLLGYLVTRALAARRRDAGSRALDAWRLSL
jgi:hypothetical protein